MWYSIDWKMTKVSHDPDCWKGRDLARGENPCRTSPLYRLPSKKKKSLCARSGWAILDGGRAVLGPETFFTRLDNRVPCDWSWGPSSPFSDEIP